MKTASILSASILALLTFAPLSVCYADEPASDADKAFVAKVSQGGMYEVEASQLAEKRAAAADIKDLAMSEIHDHTQVNHKLMKIADAAGLKVDKDLNDEFKARLNKLANTAADAFDAAYIDDMKAIHDKDEKLFAKEAEEGTQTFKAFASETDKIVKRHIGGLHAND